MRREMWLSKPTQVMRDVGVQSWVSQFWAQHHRTSFTAVALLARHGLLDFCRVRRLAGRKAHRLAGR